MNKKNRQSIQKHIRLFFIFSLFVFSGTPVHAAQNPESVTIQLNWKNQFQFAGYYVAKELGFYRKAGLEVTIKEFDAGGNVADDVLSKKVQFSVGSSSLILDAMKGKPFYLLSAIFQHSPYVLLSKKRTDLERVADLKGKRIMVTDDPISMASITAMLVANGIRSGDFISQKHTFSVDGLINNDTDAITAYISNDPYQMEKRGIGYTLFKPRDQGFDFYSDFLFTSREFYKNNPDIVARFNQASIQGWAYAFTNINTAIDIIQKKYNTQNRSGEALLYEANVLKKLAYDEGIALGNIKRERVNQIAQVYRLLGLARQTLNSDDLIYSPEKQPALKLSPDEQTWLSDHSKIRIGMMNAWPPIAYQKNNQVHGVDAELIRLLNQKLNGVLEIVSASFKQNYDQVVSKKLDAIMDLTPKPSREKYFNFTRSYLEIPHVIIGPQTKDYYNSETDLSGKTLALEKGFGNVKYFQEHFPEVKIVEYDNTNLCLGAVARGTADAYAGNRAVAMYIMKQELITNLKVQGRLNKPGSVLAIGIRKDWPELATILDKALSSISEAEKRQILDKWTRPSGAETKQPVGEREGLPKGYLLLMIGIIAAVLAILLLISWVVSRSRKRDISELYKSKELTGAGLIIISLAIGIIVLVASFRLVQFKGEVDNELKGRLQTVLNSSHQMLKFWVTGKKNELKMTLRNPHLKQAIKQQLRAPRNNTALKKSDLQDELRVFFSGDNAGIGGVTYYVISPDMVTIGAMKDRDLGRKDIIADQQKSLLQKAFLGEVVMVPPVRSDIFASELKGNKDQNRSAMFFAGPVIDDDGLVLAIVAIALSPLGDFSKIALAGRFGETGETYFINKQGLLLTESRFNNELEKMGLLKPGQFGTLNIKLVDPGRSKLKTTADQPESQNASLTLMARQSISGKAGINTEGYNGYRGVAVAGAWLWDYEFDLGLATEIDWSKAFNQYVIIRNTLVITLGITVLIALMLTGFSLWIGQSATRSLTHSKDQLELRVEERTTDLTRLEKRFRDLLESAPDSMIIVDESAVITLVNAQTEKLFGYNRDELIGNEIEAVIPHRFRAEHPAKRNGFIQSAMVSPVNVKRELIGLRKNGEEFPVEISLSPLKTDEGLLVSAAVRDITERILAEEALKESEEKNRLILDCVGEGIFGVDLEGKTMFINPAACSILGYADSELVGKKIHAVIHHTRKDGSDYPVDECPMKKAYIEGKKFKVDDEVLWNKDEQPIDVVYTSTPMVKDESIIGAVITFQDITKQKRQQAALEAQHTQMIDLVVDLPLPTALFDPKGRILTMNTALVSLLGYTEEDLPTVDDHWDLFYKDPDYREEVKRVWNAGIEESANTGSPMKPLNLKINAKSGEVYELESHTIQVGELAATMWLDFTERNKAEMQLKEKFDELERFRRLAIGRELKMIELKKKINDSLLADGLPEKYKIH